VRVAGAPQGDDALVGLAVEDEQGMVHMRAIVAVVGGPLLRPVRRVVGAVDVQDDARGVAVAFAGAQVHVEQGVGQGPAGVAPHRVLEAGQRRLAGEIRVALGSPATDELEQRIDAQRVGIVLVLVAAGDAEDALACQRLDRMVDVGAPPLGDAGRQRAADADRLLGLGEPGQPAIGGQTTAIEGGFQGESGGCGERVERCGRLW